MIDFKTKVFIPTTDIDIFHRMLEAWRPATDTTAKVDADAHLLTRLHAATNSAKPCTHTFAVTGTQPIVPTAWALTPDSETIKLNPTV